MEWPVAMYLLSAEYPLHFLDIGVDVGVVVRDQPSRLRKHSVCTMEFHSFACVGQWKNIPAGCSKRPSARPEANRNLRRALGGYVEDFDEPRTKLADFFSILPSSCMTGFMPGRPFVRECHGSIPFAKYFCHSVHQFGDSLDIFRRKILPKSRV